MQQVTDFAVQMADTPWIGLIVFACVVISAIFPPVPSTSLVVALAATTTTSAEFAYLGVLTLAMSLGSLAGDVLLFHIAARADFSSWRLLRGPKRQLALRTAEIRLERAAPIALIACRFIPLGRITCCLVAGGGVLAVGRFLLFTSAAAVVWAVYSVAVGWASALWFELPLLATVTLAVIVSLVLGRGVGMLAERLLGGDTAAED